MLNQKIKEIILSKNSLISLYFIFFIILNILDFFGLLSQDLDFFKKILSWVLIWILFYQISLTKIFVGEKLKGYDIAYIIGFSILIIPKILQHYLRDIPTDNFIVFYYIILGLKDLINTFLNIEGSFFLAILILLITNFTLLSNHQVNNKSFIGSLNLTSTLGHRITTHIALFFLVFFFAFVIAPFFLEWFALSVDALILIIGLIYYISIFIHKYREDGKISNILKLISNSGSQFFKELIETFSHKKTFFIGVSFLLALHLLVDVGIYMVPYLLGTSSPLYFDTLDQGQGNHIPLFNFFDIKESRSYDEISLIFNESNNINYFLKIVQVIFVILLYSTSYLFFLLLMIFPFFYIYKRIKNQLIHIPKYIIVFIISMSLFYILSQDFFMSSISMPLSIQTTQSIGIEGVDIQTSSIINQNQEISSVDFSDTISLLIFFILLFILFVLIRFEKYKSLFTYITYYIFLLFFINYIALFYLDLNTGIFDKQEDATKTIQTYNYREYLTLIQNNEIKTLPVEYLLDNSIELKGKVYYGIEEYIFFYGRYHSKNNQTLEKNSNIWINPENNLLLINLENPDTKDILEEISFSYNQGIKEIEKQESGDKTKQMFLNFTTYIAFFFSTIFYVIGIIIFSIHYIKTLKRRQLN